MRRWPAVAWWCALALPVFAQMPAKDTRRSGFEDMRPETQAMQQDDTQNPAMLWVAEGQALFERSPIITTTTDGASSKACSTCHSASSQMPLKGVAARYPAFDAALGRPVNLSHRINLCRQRHQQAPPLALESQPLLSLESYVGKLSRGMPITPEPDPRLAPFTARGEQLFNRRIGQINLSCAHCHTERAGARLGASTIPQGHPNAYPIYRLEWQTVGSLTRRLRSCMAGVRAEPLAAFSVEMVELELFLASRAGRMLIETPGVRP